MLFLIKRNSEICVNQTHYPTLQIRSVDGKLNILFKKIFQWLGFKTSFVYEFSGVR